MSIEARTIALHHFGEARRRDRPEVDTEHAADRLRAENDSRFPRFYREAMHQFSGRALHLLVKPLLRNKPHGGKPRRHGDWMNGCLARFPVRR